MEKNSGEISKFLWNLTENDLTEKHLPIEYSGNRNYSAKCKWQNTLNFLHCVKQSFYYKKQFY